MKFRRGFLLVQVSAFVRTRPILFELEMEHRKAANVDLFCSHLHRGAASHPNIQAPQMELLMLSKKQNKNIIFLLFVKQISLLKDNSGDLPHTSFHYVERRVFEVTVPWAWTPPGIIQGGKWRKPILRCYLKMFK